MDSIKSQLIDCLRAQGHNVDVYLSSYESEKQEEIIAEYQPVSYVFTKWRGEGCRENLCIVRGLELIEKSGKEYDLVFVTRFDMIYKRSFLDMLPDLNTTKFYFPWRECYCLLPDRTQLWRVERRVGNAFVVFAGKHLAPYRHVTSFYSDSHTVYNTLAKHIPETEFDFIIHDGFRDSNSTLEPNELYEIVRLPALH
jgi:hypothetical protein